MVIRRAPLALKIAGSKTAKAGGRGTFSYRVKAATGKAIKGVVITTPSRKGSASTPLPGG